MAIAVLTVLCAWAADAAVARRIGRLELDVLGVAATLDPLNPVVPKNIASGVRVEVRAGGALLSAADVARFLGGTSFSVQAVLSGPGPHSGATAHARAAVRTPLGPRRLSPPLVSPVQPPSARAE